MSVEDADGDRKARGQDRSSPPTAGKGHPGAYVGGVGLLVEAPAEVGEGRVEQREELGVRQTAPVVAVHRLMSGRADAALEGRRVVLPDSRAGT